MGKVDDTFGKIKKIIASVLDINTESITPDASFLYDLGIDSIDAVSLAMAIEEEFNIEINDDVPETFKTVQDAVDYIDTETSVLDGSL